MNNLFTIQESIAEVQITYSSKIKSTDRIKITSSFEAEKAFRLFWPSFEHVEFAYLLLLNRQNQIIGNYFLAKGGITGTVVDVRVIFQVALKANATSIMIAHYAKKIFMQSDVLKAFIYNGFTRKYFA